MQQPKKFCGKIKYKRVEPIPAPPVLNLNRSGILVENSTVIANEALLHSSGLKMVRVPLFLSLRTNSSIVDQYISDGFSVQLNIDWSPSVTITSFPTDMILYSSRLRTCLDYYADRFNNLPIFVCENEWDNSTYHNDATGDNYAIELDTFNTICHSYGLKTADAGFSSNNVRRWAYSLLTGDAALAWRTNYFVGLNNDYDNFIIRMNSFLDAIKSVSYDYQNMHWYNQTESFNGFHTAISLVKSHTLKSKSITNEFGINTNSFQLFQQTLIEIKDDIDYAIAYSGVNDLGKPITLTTQMLYSLAQTIK